jgi:bacterioferritin (cytochrome b1)
MTFKTTVEEIIERDFTENRKFINNVKIMENFTEEQKNCIAKSLITQ